MSIRRMHPYELVDCPPRWWRVVIVRIIVFVIVSGLALLMLKAGITWAVVGAVLVLATSQARQLVRVSGLS